MKYSCAFVMPTHLARAGNAARARVQICLRTIRLNEVAL